VILLRLPTVHLPRIHHYHPEVAEEEAVVAAVVVVVGDEVSHHHLPRIHPEIINAAAAVSQFLPQTREELKTKNPTMTAVVDVQEVNRLSHQEVRTKSQKIEMMRKDLTMTVSDEEEASLFHLPLHQEIISKTKKPTKIIKVSRFPLHPERRKSVIINDKVIQRML